MSETYKKLQRPPKEALRQITGGRLNGKTDIKPQWRYEVMDEVFGQCGVGWKFEIVKLWTEVGAKDQVVSWAQVNIYTKTNDGWSDPIPGVGGAMFIELESKGLYTNDESFKMAITDALSTALKMIGVAADIHMGLWDGTKYIDSPPAKPPASPPPAQPLPAAELAELKTALIDHINAGNFEHPENVQQVMNKNNVKLMKEALEVAKKAEAKKQGAIF